MKRQILPAIKMLLVLTVLTGICYPVFVTVVAQIAFPNKANGSFIQHDGTIVGSQLIGQKFTSERYFWSRPSATDYDPLPSSSSNLGPTSDALRILTQQREEAFRVANGLSRNTGIPTEMLFASASGLDPQISSQAAMLQVDRVAQARAFDAARKERLIELISQTTELPQFGLLGEPRVNVLMLNHALDEMR